MHIKEAGKGSLSSWIGILFVNLATFTWATNLTLARWIRADVGPLTLATIRFSVASMFFLILLRGSPKSDRHYGKDFKLLLGMGLSGVVLFAPLVYWGLHYTTAANAALINGLAPLFTALWGFMLGQDPLTKKEISGAFLAFVGVIILIYRGSLSHLLGFQVNPGDLLILGAVALWGLYSVLSRRTMQKGKRPALSTTALSTFIGLPLLWALACWEIKTISVQWSPKLVAVMFYIGIAPTVIGFVAWNAGIRRLGAFKAMIFYNSLPLYGASLGFLLLGEAFAISHILAGALIIGGGIWATRKKY